MNELTATQPTLPTLGEFSETSWTAPADMTYDEWERVGNTLQTIQGAVNWWVGDWLNEGEKRYGETYAQAIDVTGKSKQDLMNCKWVTGKIEISRRREILPYGHHAEVAALAPDKGDALLDWAEETGATRRELRQEKRRRRSEKIAEGTPDMPDDKYRIIYADPPWKYEEHGATVDDRYGGTGWHYDSLSSEQLALLPIKEIAAADAVLFIWVTSPKLNEVWSIIEAWGFEYKTSFVWDKVRHNFGYYNSVRHELLLVCGRGSSTPDASKLYDSVQEIERSNRHSEKPEEFRSIIDDLYRHGKRIELFARQPIPGWEVWGNEA